MPETIQSNWLKRNRASTSMATHTGYMLTSEEQHCRRTHQQNNIVLSSHCPYPAAPHQQPIKIYTASHSFVEGLNKKQYYSFSHIHAPFAYASKRYFKTYLIAKIDILKCLLKPTACMTNCPPPSTPYHFPFLLPKPCSPKTHFAAPVLGYPTHHKTQ